MDQMFELLWDDDVGMGDIVELLEADDDSEVGVGASGGQAHERNEHFLHTVQSYSEEDFRMHFRVQRGLALQLAKRFRSSTYFCYQQGRDGRLEPYEQVLIFLWFCGHEAASFRDVADRFDITISSLFVVLRRLIYFISSLSTEVIRWPDDDEKVEIATSFGRLGLPNAIGAIDGSHIRIDRPSEDPDSYYNRKKYHSIHIQAVCDHKRKIRSVFIGFPGSVHDAHAFRRSPLGERLATLCGQYYILGDSAYPCLRNLITSFKDCANLSRATKSFNRLHSKGRIVIEHSFSMLEQKFRQLYHCKLRSMRDLAHFIRACCVLHNLALDDRLPEDIPPEPTEEPQEPNIINEDRDAPNGVAYRNYLVSII